MRKEKKIKKRARHMRKIKKRKRREAFGEGEIGHSFLQGCKSPHDSV